MRNDLFQRVFITGDTHGDFRRLFDFCEKAEPGKEDCVILLGDAGLNYFDDVRDTLRKQLVNSLPFTTFCIHGNHEMRPSDIATYREVPFCGGTAWQEDKYPHLVFAKDGEIYEIGGYSCIAIGGAYSVDKTYRLARGIRWFENEQPDSATKAFVEQQLAGRGNQIDIVLSHTCPRRYLPIEAFKQGVDQSTVDQTTELWLDQIEQTTAYKKWYCGHFHIDRCEGQLRFMYENICMLP